MAELWAGRPRFSDWLARVRARPSFREAFYPGSRLSERPEFAGALAARSPS
jgi:glutathione S-transferase